MFASGRGFGGCQKLNTFFKFASLHRNSSVNMGAAVSMSEYSLKVADVAKVRTLNAIAKNTL